MDPRRQAVVDAALSQVGHPDVAAYWQSCGFPTDMHEDWCGVFCLSRLHAAGLALDVKWKIGLGFLYQLTRTADPEPGDIGYYDKPFQHHDVVVSLQNGILKTVDGNAPGVKVSERPVPTGAAFYSIDKFLKATSQKVATPGEVATSDELLRGIDVSRYQDPSHVDYDRLAKTHRFIVARASYGDRPDDVFVEHVRRAQGAGLVIGAYSFFRAGQPVADQLDAFNAAVGAVGMGPGWLPPTLDVEQNQQYDGPVSPARYATARQLVEALRSRWGAAMVYTNPSMWAEIGSPDWIKDHLLWISHYGVQHPTTPFGMHWTIWQHTVAPLPGIAPGQVDQDVASDLPLLHEHDPASPLLLAVDWDSLRADRDAQVQEADA